MRRDPGARPRGASRVATVDSTRRANMSAVLRLVHLTGGASRSDLAAATGLNRSTVATLVGELVARDLVAERRPPATGLPGRPSPVVAPRADRLAVLALEVFPDSAAAALVGVGGQVLALERHYRAREPHDPVAFASALADLAGPMLAHRSVAAVGVAVSGVVAREGGIVVRAPNLGWRNVGFAELVRGALALPPAIPVLLGNDADLGALAEHRRGAGVGTDDFVLLWGGIGVGAGILAGGRSLTGRDGSAGEVGHLPFITDGRPCHCGARGCWETEIGERSLLERAGISSDAGPAAVDRLLDEARAGSPCALDAIREVGRQLGVGLAGIVAVLDPERVALGGLFGRLHPWVHEIIAHELGERRMTDREVEVVAAMLGDDAPLLGAAELALDPSIDDPAAVPVAATAADPLPAAAVSIGR